MFVYLMEVLEYQAFFQCRIVQTQLYFVNMSGTGGRSAG